MEQLEAERITVNVEVSREKPLNLAEFVRELEHSIIVSALEVVGGVKAQAAVILGMKRTTLVEKMKRYGIT